MVEDFGCYGQYLIFGSRPKIYNRFFYSVSPYNLIYGFTEIPERFTSLYPIIDYVVDNEDFSRYLSFFEKIVLDDFYRIPPMAFALLGYYDDSGSTKLVELFKRSGSIRFSTTQWYSWDNDLFEVSGGDLFLNFIFSYSRYNPSKFRPGVVNSKSVRFYVPINYLNAPSFGGYRSVHFSGRIRLWKPLLLPPNFFIKDDVAVSKLRIWLYSLGEVECFGDIEVRGSEYMERRFKDFIRFFDCDLIILPIFFVRDGNLGLYYKVWYDNRVIDVDNMVFEWDDFVIDPFNRYRGGKFRVFFSLWNVPFSCKGFSLKVNLNFAGFLTVFSRMFVEVRYGGKVLCSYPSILGIL